VSQPWAEEDVEGPAAEVVGEADVGAVADGDCWGTPHDASSKDAAARNMGRFMSEARSLRQLL
jgi:hypothetical protein